MGILDNEGHDPMGFGNVLSRTDANDLRRLKEENERLRAIIRCEQASSKCVMVHIPDYPTPCTPKTCHFMGVVDKRQAD